MTEKRRDFNPKDLAKDSRAIRQAFDLELGVINYRPLAFKDMPMLEKAKTNVEKCQLGLFIMLHAAYPDLTLEEVKQFELTKVSRLAKLLAGGMVPKPLGEADPTKKRDTHV